jgi:hypothetical protein
MKNSFDKMMLGNGVKKSMDDLGIRINSENSSDILEQKLLVLLGNYEETYDLDKCKGITSEIRTIKIINDLKKILQKD